MSIDPDILERGDGRGRPVPQLLEDFQNELLRLIREEVALAKQETKEKVRGIGTSGAYFTAGVLFGYLALVLLVLAGVAGIYDLLVAADVSRSTAVWLALLIGTVILALVAAGLMALGRSKLKRHSLALEKTKRSLRENKDWAENQFG